ncbi:hypothetical protein JTB14_025269 [Gonioctena quinquepunctata]|nr:hypothetical protein JTB14_025269 [Gonioctena quinquepunctata]
MSFHCPLCRINNIPQITQRLNNIEQEIQDHSSNLNGKLVTLEQRILRIEQFIESNKLIEQRLLKIEQILDLNKSLQQRLSTLEQLVESPRASPSNQNNCEIGTNSSDCETFILEVEERKRRSTNLMVYNLPENDNPDVDKRKIGHVFKDIIPTDCIKKVFRIGKKSGSSWHCKYEFAFGPDWKIIGGLEAGMSQVANVVNNGDKVVLNLPVEIQFKSTNPYGWPQIILSIYKSMQLAGYGRCHMPLRPGSHTLDIHLAKPQASSMLGYIASFFGYQPELLQPKMLATTAGNNLIQMENSGHAQMVLNVVTQGFQSLGYDIGNMKFPS